MVGIAGSDEKVEYVTQELGFDAAFNYKVVDDYSPELQELMAQTGIDVYFDNVGGAITDAVIPLLNVKARVAICGQISQYNLETPQMGPRLLWQPDRQKGESGRFSRAGLRGAARRGLAQAERVGEKRQDQAS